MAVTHQDKVRFLGATLRLRGIHRILYDPEIPQIAERRYMDKWYENPQILMAAVEEYGSIEAAARAIGGASVSTVQKAYRRLDLPKRSPGPVPRGEINQEALRNLAEKVYGGRVGG